MKFANSIVLLTDDIVSSSDGPCTTLGLNRTRIAFGQSRLKISFLEAYHIISYVFFTKKKTR